ncbi:MAG: hypothetical protein AAFR16_08225 [Pseudomonadota bacterium]
MSTTRTAPTALHGAERQPIDGRAPRGGMTDLTAQEPRARRGPTSGAGPGV